MLTDKQLTYRINGCIYEVYRQLGHGFLEKIYENALALELQRAGLEVTVQKNVPVRYKGELIGEYQADLIVEGRVLIELKATDKLHPAHEAQLINYLRATGIQIGLLVNFAFPKAEIKRFVF
jgi:GxxExxY protein